MSGFYSMSAWSERIDLLTDVIDPIAGPVSWFVDPVNGSDTNDGVTAGSAWLTAEKVNGESKNCGMFPAASYALGNTLTIDTRVQNWLLETETLNILTSGLNVIQLGGGLTGTGEIQAWKQITAGEWAGPIASTTKVYQATLSEASTHIVLWEDDKWMNHPTGANLAAVQATLESTPGSFWTDGTTMYCHPFADTNPTSDGKLYTRSYNRGATGVSAVNMLAPHLRLSGLRVRKTCLAHSATNDSILGYCIQSNSAAGGISLLENCYGDYGSKHIFGFTDNSLDKAFTILNCQAEQGSPYFSQSPWVDYSSSASTGTNTTDYINCVTNRTAGLIGSTTGRLTGGECWLTHNNGSANFQFASINFIDCNFQGPVNTYGAAAVLNFTRGRCGGGEIRTTAGTFSRVLIEGQPPSQDGTGSTTVINCIIKPINMFAGSARNAMSVIQYFGCTLDLRGTASNSNLIAFFKRVGALNITWRDNLFIGHGSLSLMILENGRNTDTLNFSNNAYVLSPTGKLFRNYNDGTTTADRTFAQWQALGKDTASLTTTAATAVDANYYPIKDSPLIGAGTDRGQAVDYSGEIVERVSIGALERLVSALSNSAVLKTVLQTFYRSVLR